VTIVPEVGLDWITRIVFILYHWIGTHVMYNYGGLGTSCSHHRKTGSQERPTEKK
jgi:hypothetical protein